MPFPALPQPQVLDPDELTNLGSFTLRGDVRSFNWDGSGDLAGGADAGVTSGFFLDASAGAAQFQEIFAFGGSFTDVTIEGDFQSDNWDGSDPADLSAGPDAAATAGFYFDSSAGAAQFTGPVYFAPPAESTEGTGTVIDLSDGFFFRVYQDNPTLGEDTLWFGIDTDDTDHMVLGPPASLSKLKTIRFRSNLITHEGLLWINKGASSGNEQIRFSDTDYAIYQDNTGPGADNSRLWIAGPDNGALYLGPRSGSEWLELLSVRADTLGFSWRDSGGDVGNVNWPRGIIYDHGSTSASSVVAFDSGGDILSQLVATVPANVAVSIFVWGWFKFDNSLDQVRAYCYINVGGSTAGQTASIEQDLTTGAQSVGHTHSTPDHQHPLGIYHTESHAGNTSSGGASTTGGISAGHTHALGPNEMSLFYSGVRSYTPTGSTVNIDLVGLTDSGSQNAGGRNLSYMVVVN